MLNAYGIEYKFHLFRIAFNDQSETRWSMWSMFIVFGTGPIVLSAIGAGLIFLMNTISRAGWKSKLWMTWLSYLFVHSLPLALFAGALIYDSFGIIYTWMVRMVAIRIFLALVVVGVLLLYRRFWLRLFLKTAYTKAFYDNEPKQETFIEYVCFRPLAYGFVVLAAFNWSFDNTYWLLFLFSLGYLIIPTFDYTIKQNKPLIKRSDKKIFPDKLLIVALIALLVLIWIADNFIMI